MGTTQSTEPDEQREFSRYEYADTQTLELRFTQSHVLQVNIIHAIAKYGDIGISLATQQDAKLELIVNDKVRIRTFDAIVRYMGNLTLTYYNGNPLDAAKIDDMLIDFQNRVISANSNASACIEFLEASILDDSTWVNGFPDPTIVDFCWYEFIQLQMLPVDLLNTYPKVSQLVVEMKEIEEDCNYENDDDN